MNKYFYFNRVSIVLCVIFAALLSSSNIYACASCGSGDGGANLYLSPLQKYQVLMGSRFDIAGENVDFEGERSENFDVDRVLYLDLAGAMRLTKRATVGFSASLQHNISSDFDSEDTGWKDPGVNARYTLYRQSIARPLLPQMQIVGSYRPGINKPLYESREPGAVDNFGPGNNDLSVGYDLWNGLHNFQVGLAQSYTYSFEHKEGDNRIQSGPVLGSIVSLGYQLSRYKWTLGYSNSCRFSPKRLNGSAIPSSTSMTHRGFLSFDWRFYKSFKLRTNVAQTIPSGAFKTQDRTSISVALLYSGI